MISHSVPTPRPARSRPSGAAPRPVLVLGKVRRVLDAFGVDRPALTAREVQRHTGLPASTCLRLLGALVEEGFLDRTGDRYRLGLATLGWARTAMAGLDLVTLATPVLTDLRDRTEESACLYVRDGMHHVCVAVVETPHPVVSILRVGQSLPLHAGSAGRIFYAYDPMVREDLLCRPLPAFTGHTLTDPAAIERAAEQTLRDGFAVSVEERSVGAASVSAPVRDHTGAVAAALGVVSPVQRFGAERVPVLTTAVLDAASDLSRRLGHLPDPQLKGDHGA